MENYCRKACVHQHPCMLAVTFWARIRPNGNIFDRNVLEDAEIQGSQGVDGPLQGQLHRSHAGTANLIHSSDGSCRI